MADAAGPEHFLAQLAGCWRGRGRGSYPTIESFRYDETVYFEYREEYPLIHYEQRTRLRSGESSHWESGFLRWLPDSTIELSSAQDGGRLELLRGVLSTVEGGFDLDLRSAVLGNDSRLLQTRRRWTVLGDQLRYRMEMSTTTTESPRILQHLEAELERSEEAEYPWGSA